MGNQPSCGKISKKDFFNLCISTGVPVGSTDRCNTEMNGHALGLMLPARTPISEIVQHNPVSVRLGNCISNAVQNDLLPIETIGEYHQMGIRAKDVFRMLPNFGRKSAVELYELLNSFKLGRNEGPTLEDAISTNNSFSKLIADKFRYALKDVVLPELITQYPVSTRVRNFFRSLQPDAVLDHGLSLSDYLENPVASKDALFRHQSLGKKSIEEIHAFISEWLMLALLAAKTSENEIEIIHHAIFDKAPMAVSENEKLLLLSKIDQFDFFEYAKPKTETLAMSAFQEFYFTPEQSLSSKIEQVLSSILDDRQKDVVTRRYGLSGSKETLEAIAQGYGITRERVRQIEKKAIRMCRLDLHIALFRRLLSEEKNSIKHKLFKDGLVISIPALKLAYKGLPKSKSFLIDIVEKSAGNWLSNNFHEVFDGEVIVAWSINPDVTIESEINLQIGDDIAQRIKSVIEISRWPLPLKHLHEQIIDVPPHLLENMLLEKFQANFEDDCIISINNLPASTRLILVLRMAGQGLQISEVVARHKKMFGLEIDEGAARNCLGRLDEALIVDRGKYDLYENLKLEVGHLDSIRGLVLRYLSECGQFVSTKKIHADVFLHRMQDFPERLTDYMILGILQDDPRFDVRRGLMVGLAHEDFDGSFRPLSEEIWEIVDKYGPLSIAEIKSKLSETRSILETSIGIALQNMRDIAANKDGSYDKVERIFESIDECEQVCQAIVINLLGGEVSLFVLRERLQSVGIDISNATLRSLILSDENIEYSGKLASLLSIDESVKKYDSLVETAVKNGKRMQEIKSIFEKFPAQSNELIMKLVQYSQLDGRFSLTAEKAKSSEGGLLGKILMEFDPS